MATEKGELLNEHPGGVRVARMQTPPGVHEVLPQPYLMVGTHVGDPLTIALEHEEGARRRQFVFGDVWVIPPRTSFLCEHADPTDDVYVLVDPDVVAETAEGLGAELEILLSLGAQDATLQHIAHALLRERASAGLGGELYTEALVTQLVVHLLRSHTDHRAPADEEAGPPSLQPALELIHDNLGSRLSLREMAAAAHLSPHHFSRSFKEATGISPHQYVLRQRVELARRLLATSRMPISEVARHVGFYDQSHLSAHFKRAFGVTPGALRNGR